MKKAMRWFVALAVLTALFCCATALAEDSGTCGENLTWVLDDAGTLTISGTGEMYRYEWRGSPFYKKDSVKSVIIDDGVTSIGEYALECCGNLTSITLAESVTSIG